MPRPFLTAFLCCFSWGYVGPRAGPWLVRCRYPPHSPWWRLRTMSIKKDYTHAMVMDLMVGPNFDSIWFDYQVFWKFGPLGSANQVEPTILTMDPNYNYMVRQKTNFQFWQFFGLIWWANTGTNLRWSWHKKLTESSWSCGEVVKPE